MNILSKIYRLIQCAKNGHNSEPFFTDGKAHIYTHRCSNCHTPLGLPKFKNYNCPPPPCTGLKMSNAEWNQWVDNNIKKIENEINLKRLNLTQQT